MSATARANGWNGFDGIGDKTEGGWLYRCDGMPTLMGCGAELVITVRLKRVGKKKSGWLVCYGQEPKPGMPGQFDDPSQWQDDRDVVLTFCPSCSAVVEEQQK